MTTPDLTRDLEPAALANWLNGEADHQERIAARYKAASTFRATYSRRAEILRSCARALSEPAAPAGAEVVALQWEFDKHTCNWFANSPMGQYRVWGLAGIAYFSIGRSDRHEAASVEEAKAAAQTDFETRIRSALTTPQPVEPPDDTLNDIAADPDAFPPTWCTAWEDCNHDGLCHDPQDCGGVGPNSGPFDDPLDDIAAGNEAARDDEWGEAGE